MPRWTTRILALVVGSVPAAGLVLVARPVLEDVAERRPASEEAAVALRESPPVRHYPDCDEELAAARAKNYSEDFWGGSDSPWPGWAGNYATPGPGAWSFQIAPESGYVLYRRPPGGGIETRESGGVVRHDDGRVELEPDVRRPVPDAVEPPADWFGLGETLFLARWGEHRLAVPGWRMETFCAEVNAGLGFPRVPLAISCCMPSPWGAGPPPRPAGLPDVPVEFRSLLIDAPVACTVVALSGIGEDPAGHTVARFAVDAGAEAGLAPGVRMHVEVGGEILRGRVEEVEPDRAVLELLLEGTGVLPADLVGRRANSLHPRAPGASRDSSG